MSRHAFTKSISLVRIYSGFILFILLIMLGKNKTKFLICCLHFFSKETHTNFYTINEHINNDSSQTINRYYYIINFNSR